MSLRIWEFDRSEEELAKSDLAIQINKIIHQKGWTQKKAAGILGIDQPKVSALKNGRLGGFSIERLLSFLRALDRDIDIVVRPKTEDVAHIQVAEQSIVPGMSRDKTDLSLRILCHIIQFLQ